jgi:AraC-like DNA-binding protein
MACTAALPAPLPTERISLLRDPALPGLEVLKVDDSMRDWKVFNTVHSLSISESWFGRVDYRGRAHEVRPGSVFCTEPGEVHATSRPAVPGAIRVLTFQEQLLAEQLAEFGLRTRAIHFSEIITPKAAPQLRRLSALFGAAGRTPLELQTAFVDLAVVVAYELVADGPMRRATRDNCSEVADGMRELLHARVDDGASVSLDELAAAAKLGKFQALRAFKRRHGIPPHTYGLCLRLSRARELIKGGMTAAAAATECGFADQSHMIRHFRRFYGHTPGAYIRDAARG